MSNSYKERFYSTSYLWKEDYHAGGGDGIVGVGHRTTHFYSQKYDFGRDRHYGTFRKSQHQHTATPMLLFSSIDYVSNRSCMAEVLQDFHPFAFFHMQRGTRSSQGGCFATASNVPGVLLRDFWFPRSVM